MSATRFGILTVSDRASRGEYEDAGGPAVEKYLREVVESPFETVTQIVSDELDQIVAALTQMADEDGCCLIITTGGTGPALRDVTPEATAAVCEKMLPGFGEQMRQISLQFVPTAILSRQTAGCRGRTLIVNLPGKPRAIAQCLDAIFAAIPYCIELIEGPNMETNNLRFVAFRPQQS